MKRKARNDNNPYTCSGRLYIQLAPSDVALFRFLLEANDNLALFTVVQRKKAILLLRFSPDQEQEVQEFLTQAKTEMEIEIVYAP